MSITLLDKQMVQYAVYGGAILGGGGGGWIEDGLQAGNLAVELADLNLYSLDHFADEDWLATMSLVGAPAAPDRYIQPIHHITALKKLQTLFDRPLAAIHTNENGASTTVNGWLQSAITGIPLVDFACNGRAHPTGSMGAMNLSEVENYVAYQAAVGGKSERYLELGISGRIRHTANMVRSASVEAGGLVAVARNPVQASYARQHGAVGAITQAIQIGEALFSQTGTAAIEAVVSRLGGQVQAEGEVITYELQTSGGFDAGKVVVQDRRDTYDMTLWNEYMTLERAGERISTFPDLIMTLDAYTGRPIITAQIKQGQRVVIITVPKAKLLLSSTMSNIKLMLPIEEIVQRPIISYL